MAGKTVQETILEKFRVKVIKREPDTRISIAGERFINPGHPEHDGENIDGRPVAYAVVPAHVSDDLQKNNKQYLFSEPYMPAAAPARTTEETVFTCSKCGITCASKVGLISHERACKG